MPDAAGEEQSAVERLWALLRSVCCACCCWPVFAPRRGDSYGSLLEARGTRLLSGQQQESAIEASRSPAAPPPLLAPPRLPPPVTERTALLKGHGGGGGASSGGDGGAAGAGAGVGGSGHRHAPSSGSRPSSKQSGSGAASEGGSPRPKLATSESKLSLLEDDDMCPTCLEGYSEDNPKVLATCGHCFHLQCAMQWAQRSRECPLCFAALRLEDESLNELLPFGEYVAPL